MNNAPKSGEYENLISFINKNNLQDAFRQAVSGDRSIEDYLDKYAHIDDIEWCVLHDMGFIDRVEFSATDKKRFKFK